MSKRNRPAPPPARKPMDLAALNRALADSMTAGEIPRRPFQAPVLPPGVVPRGATPRIAMDNGMFGWLNNQAGFCGLGFPGYTYLAELAQRSEYRAPSETNALEMTRAWIELQGGDEAQTEELNEAIEEFQLESHIKQLITYDGEFGRGQLSINIKGQDTDQRRKLPLIIDDENKGSTIPKGSLLGFKPIEPIWTTPWMYNSIDPTKPDFYVPEAWYILGKQTHASRLLTYVSHALPDILKPSYNFSGLSMSQLIEPYVVRWLKTVDSVNRMISNYSTSGFLTNMQAELSDDNSGGMSLLKRVQLFNQTKDNRGCMILDKESEEFFQFNTPLSGLSELQAQAQEHMAAPTHQPLVVLTGITPSGLNASSEGEIKVWFNHVGAKQKGLTPIVRACLKVMQLHLWGKVDPKIGFRWVPLDSPTDKEESEMRKADGDRDAAYVTNDIVSPDEVRERLRTEKNSGYAFITGPAPAPLLEENDMENQNKDADAVRGEETAQAQHERDKDMVTHEAKHAPRPVKK